MTNTMLLAVRCLVPDMRCWQDTRTALMLSMLPDTAHATVAVALIESGVAIDVADAVRLLLPLRGYTLPHNATPDLSVCIVCHFPRPLTATCVVAFWLSCLAVLVLHARDSAGVVCHFEVRACLFFFIPGC